MSGERTSIEWRVIEYIWGRIALASSGTMKAYVVDFEGTSAYWHIRDGRAIVDQGSVESSADPFDAGKRECEACLEFVSDRVTA